MKRIAAFACGLIVAGAGHGAIRQCDVPDRVATPRPDLATLNDPARTVPIGGYTLAMIWGPQHCRATVAGAAAMRCNVISRRGFTLHGLWPDGEGREWPQYCAPTPILSQQTLRAHYCATPSAQLMQHEWAKHGTCLPGATPDSYFDKSNALFGGLRFPPMGDLSRRARLTSGQFAGAFAKANSGIRADMVRFNLDRAGWLQEVWLCLDKAFAPTRCPVPMAGDTPLRIWRARG